MRHKHIWVKTTDQSDTGLIGVRKQCVFKYQTGLMCGDVQVFPEKVVV